MTLELLASVRLRATYTFSTLACPELRACVTLSDAAAVFFLFVTFLALTPKQLGFAGKRRATLRVGKGLLLACKSPKLFGADFYASQ